MEDREISNELFLLIKMIAYNLHNWFKRSFLPEDLHHHEITTIRRIFYKVVGNIVGNGWYRHIRFTPNKLLERIIPFVRNNTFCGELFYMKDLKHKRSGLDIKFLPEFQGKWLATEALKLFIDLIFEIEEKERPDDMESAESYWELTKKRLCEIGKSNIFLLITGFNTNSSNKMSLTCSSRRLLRISPD